MVMMNEELPSQEELNGVYRDISANQFVILEIDEENECVREMNAVHGSLVHEFDFDEFIDEWVEGQSFNAVDEEALNNPLDVMKSYIRDSLTSTRNPALIGEYDITSIEFALQIVDAEMDEMAFEEMVE